MPRTVWLVAAFCLSLFTQPIFAQAPLQWHWKEKETFFVEWRAHKNAWGRRGGMEFRSQEDVTVVLRCLVQQCNSDGTVVLEMRVESIKDEVRGGNPDIMPGMLEGAVLQATLDGRARVVKVDGGQSVVKRLLGPNAGAKGEMVLAMVEDQVKVWLEDIFFLLPEKPLAQGNNWQQETEMYLAGFARQVRTKSFTAAGDDTIDGHKVQKITVRGTDVLRPSNRDESALAIRKCKAELHKGDYKGTLYFDPTAGRLLQAETRLWTELTTSFELQGRTFEAWGSQDQTTNVRVLDKDPRPAPKDPVAVKPEAVTSVAASDYTNSLGMKLVRIPAGKFLMGSPQTEEDRQGVEDQHEVEITRPFYMGIYEVTIGQYRQFVKATGYRTHAEKSGRGCFGYNKAANKVECSPSYSWDNPGWEHTDEHPVANLSWHDAREFCEWLSRKEGRTYRLPTEAEWEYACRAGSKTRYSSGDDAETLATIGNVTDASAKKQFPQWRTLRADDGYVFTAPVGRFKPNAFGLYDMHGNALEWCNDWYWRYDVDRKMDPKGPPIGQVRVQRGGSWADFPDQCRSAFRTGFDPNAWCISSGFRVVVDGVSEGAAGKADKQATEPRTPAKEENMLPR